MANNVSIRLFRTSTLDYGADGRIYRAFYETFQKRVEQGDQRDCFATKFFAVADDFGFDKDQQMFVAGTLIEAGKPTLLQCVMMEYS